MFRAILFLVVFGFLLMLLVLLILPLSLFLGEFSAYVGVRMGLLLSWAIILESYFSRFAILIWLFFSFYLECCKAETISFAYLDKRLNFY